MLVTEVSHARDTGVSYQSHGSDPQHLVNPRRLHLTRRLRPRPRRVLRQLLLCLGAEHLLQVAESPGTLGLEAPALAAQHPRLDRQGQGGKPAAKSLEGHQSLGLSACAPAAVYVWRRRRPALAMQRLVCKRGKALRHPVLLVEDLVAEEARQLRRDIVGVRGPWGLHLAAQPPSRGRMVAVFVFALVHVVLVVV